MEAVISLIPFDVLGMPGDVVLLLLREMHCARAATRLGLSNSKLLTWIDSQDAFWASAYEESDFDVHSALRPLEKLRMGHQAVRNIQDPSFNSFHTIYQKDPRRNSVSIKTQNGSNKVLCDVWAASLHPTVLLDISQWPTCSSVELESKLESGSPAVKYHLHLVCSSKIVSFPFDITNETYGTNVFSIDSREIVPDRFNRHPPELGKHISEVSTDARLPRVAHVNFRGPNILASVYDVEADRWSRLVSVPKNWRDPYQYTLFNGEFLVCYYLLNIVIVRFDRQTMEPTVIFQGSFPKSQCPGSITLASTCNHLVIRYSTELSTNIDDIGKSKIGRVRFDEIERSGTIWSAEFESSSFDVPTKHNVVTHGNLAILYQRSSAVIVDFDQKKILRSMEIGSAYFSPREFHFVDSTMFYIITANEVVVVDLLSRRGPDSQSSIATKPPFLIFGPPTALDNI